MQEKLMIESSDISRLLGTVGSPLIVISELIKNSVDADASKIEIIYNQDNRYIQVIDNGIGFSIAELNNLMRPGYSSKKIGKNIRNNRGFFFTGNKGLGILSCFSICEEITIETNTANGEKIHAVLDKNGVLNYDVNKNNDVNNAGTTITLIEVAIDDIDYLITTAEIKKLKHLSTFLYKSEFLNFPGITLRINDEIPQSIFLDTDFKDMLYDFKFNYNKDTNKLSFTCTVPDNRDINHETIEIDMFDMQSLDEIAIDKYQIQKTIYTRTNDTADIKAYTELENVPSFEGRILVFDKQNAGPILKQYGAGVNIYVNDFALYNYLSSDNDWLGLADYSQRKKLTNLRPHNVFGYVNFNNFNENIETLRISNERADFIQDQTFTKLMYLLKGVVIFLALNIDVAEKNPKYKAKTDDNEPNNQETDKQSGGSNTTDRKSQENNDYTETKTNTGNKNDGGNQDKNNENNSIPARENTNNNFFQPEDIFKPKNNDISGLKFTQSEGMVINKLKNIDDLSNKIYHIVYELSKLNIQSHYCAIAALYRTLIECATRYFFEKNGSDKLKFTENELQTNVLKVINYYGNKQGMDKNVKQWRETISRRYLIDTLNNYMHTGTAVDINVLEGTWNTMKSYIIKCIS